VKAAEALGCKAFRVFEPSALQETIQAARALAQEQRVPVIVEAITERRTNIAMGPEIDKVTEFEETIDVAAAKEKIAA
jgi:tartronate-semialdehyde synthase